jgi:hypothetical protein
MFEYSSKDVGYVASVQIGNPPQEFRILMDSGSADLWVGAENCQSETGGGCVSEPILLTFLYAVNIPEFAG